MASRPVQAQEWKCDGCGRTELVSTGGKPDGYHGQVDLHGRSVGEKPFWACGTRCIRRAVLRVTGQSGGGSE